MTQIYTCTCTSVYVYERLTFVRTYDSIRKRKQNIKYPFDDQHKQLAGKRRSAEREQIKTKSTNSQTQIYTYICISIYIYYIWKCTNVCTKMICSWLSRRAVGAKVMALTHLMVKAGRLFATGSVPWMSFSIFSLTPFTNAHLIIHFIVQGTADND